MANRNIQSKILKMKRRGRYAVFSGATSVFTPDRSSDGIVLVGKISLSKQVVSTGRGPNQERMQSYYQRVSAKSYSSELPPTKGMTEPMKELQDAVARLRGAVPAGNRIMLVDNRHGMLMLCFGSEKYQWFFIDVDYKTKVFRRSCDYSKKQTALDRLKNKRIIWVERISPVEVMATTKS